MYGLSPRGRWKRFVSSTNVLLSGSIPAWAGETSGRQVRREFWAVYPRVGGGNAMSKYHVDKAKGLSPRGRGKLIAIPIKAESIRSIPAWAGETRQHASTRRLQEVYPRVGGGNEIKMAETLYPEGLSPRGRGKRQALRPDRAQKRSIPAWAGETAMTAMTMPAPAVYPRVGGGNARHPAEGFDVEGLSPRGRGKPPLWAQPSGAGGSIPAWAGETVSPIAARSMPRVYPRVGGGNSADAGRSRPPRGLSPRGRGKHHHFPPADKAKRSIPAWAGETDVDTSGTRGNAVYPRVGGGNV